MTFSGWNPITFEDRLLENYLTDNPGLLFLEVEVGTGGDNSGPRRLDGLLVPGKEMHVRPQTSYSQTEVAAAVKDNHVHLLEAKQKLNRTVIGQVQVGMALLNRGFSPASVLGVAVCAQGNSDLEWYCSQQDISMALYPEVQSVEAVKASYGPVVREDLRQAPDSGRRRAFMRGWDDAVAGTLYRSVHEKKTHANMGNLFGWIYGDKPADFRQDTWERYVDSIE